MTLLEMASVCGGYGTREVLHGVDLRVEPGQVHGLIGPNGSGKSTLLALAAGLLHPFSGTIGVGGAPIETLAPRRRAGLLALMPQDHPARSSFTIREVALLGRQGARSVFSRVGPDDHRAVDAALELTGASAFADEPLSALSGGQRQLGSLTRVLAQDAGLLLLDEPLSALDIAHQVAVLSVLRTAADAGRGIVVVLHDLDLTARGCDTVSVLHSGVVRASGPVADALSPDLVSAVYATPLEVFPDPFTGHLRFTPTPTTRPLEVP